MSENETEPVVDTERVAMVWPKALKTAVREKAGHRAITEFTIDAVEQHLTKADVQRELTLELNETKELAQLLADRMAMGGADTTEDRLMLMQEVGLPGWIDTTGWPKTFADLVRPEPASPELEPVAEKIDPAQIVVTPPKEAKPEPEPTPAPMADLPPDMINAPVVMQKRPEAAVPTDKNDLFARIMEKTGGNLEAFEGLKRASEITPPEAKPQEDRCLVCNEVLVDGECWTCPPT